LSRLQDELNLVKKQGNVTPSTPVVTPQGTVDLSGLATRQYVVYKIN